MIDLDNYIPLDRMEIMQYYAPEFTRLFYDDSNNDIVFTYSNN